MFVQENGVKKIGNWIANQQIDSMLTCICSVIDQRWHQNEVRTKKSGTGGAAKVVTDVHFIKMSYITRTVIPCSLQSIAIQQDTMLDKRYFHGNLYVDPLSSESANIKHF